MRTLAMIFIGFITYFIQAQLFPVLIHTWQPNLILAWIVMLAALRSWPIALLAAVVGGLVHDIVISNFFGLHFFPYIVIAYIFSREGRRLYEEQWYWAFVYGAIATLLDGMIRCFMLYIAKESVQFWLYMWHYTLAPVVVNGFLCIVLHELLWSLEEKDEYIW